MCYGHLHRGGDINCMPPCRETYEVGQAVQVHINGWLLHRSRSDRATKAGHRQKVARERKGLYAHMLNLISHCGLFGSWILPFGSTELLIDKGRGARGIVRVCLCLSSPVMPISPPGFVSVYRRRGD